MVQKGSLPSSGSSLLTGAWRCACWRVGHNAHGRAGMHRQLASDDNLLAIRNAFGHDDVVALPLPERNLAKIRSVVLLNHVNERTLLADLRRLVRNQHSALRRRQNQPYIDELAGPKVPIG